VKSIIKHFNDCANELNVLHSFIAKATAALQDLVTCVATETKVEVCVSQKLEKLKSLHALLDRNEPLKGRGYRFEVGLNGGILVERAGHVRGLWRFDPKGYSWTPAGYNVPVCWVGDAATATHYTQEVLAA
jgi:hypothetical protein